MVLLFQPGDTPGSPNSPKPMTIDEQITDLKLILDHVETEYQHTMATGDWVACSAAKSKVAKVRNRIGKLIKIRMGIA